MIVLYRRINNPVFDHWHYAGRGETIPIYRDELHTVRCVWSHEDTAYERERARVFAEKENYNILIGPDAWDKVPR